MMNSTVQLTNATNDIYTTFLGDKPTDLLSSFIDIQIVLFAENYAVALPKEYDDLNNGKFKSVWLKTLNSKLGFEYFNCTSLAGRDDILNVAYATIKAVADYMVVFNFKKHIFVRCHGYHLDHPNMKKKLRTRLYDLGRKQANLLKVEKIGFNVPVEVEVIPEEVEAKVEAKVETDPVEVKTIRVEVEIDPLEKGVQTLTWISKSIGIGGALLDSIDHWACPWLDPSVTNL